MKKIVILLIAALLAASLCASAMAASVYFNGTVNVRTGPGLGYSIIGSVNSGTSLTWLGGTQYDGRGVAWYSVSYGTRVGWVSSTYATLSDYDGYDGYDGYYDTYDYGEYTDTVYGSTGDSFVRTGPGLGYTSFGTLYKGQSAPYLGSISYDSRGVAWYMIRFNNRTGWVSSRYTSVY